MDDGGQLVQTVRAGRQQYARMSHRCRHQPHRALPGRLLVTGGSVREPAGASRVPSPTYWIHLSAVSSAHNFNFVACL